MTCTFSFVTLDCSRVLPCVLHTLGEVFLDNGKRPCRINLINSVDWILAVGCDKCCYRMSSRALRKAQREREEQERLQNLQQEENDDGVEDEDEVPAAVVNKSAFAMLEEEASDADEDQGVPVGEDGTEEEQIAETTATLPPKSSSNKKKKKKKKGKGGAGTASNVTTEGDNQLDDIDKALRQLSTNGNASATGATTAGVDSKADETAKLLAVDTNHLHAQNEMRRLFGRAALEQEDEDQPAPQANVGGNRRQQRRIQQVGLAQALRGHGVPGGRAGGLAAVALRRNIFIQGKEEWPIATGGGLGMEVEEKRADGTWLYRFVHNRIYQDVQMQFQMAVESMDPNRLVVLLQHNPYHISTLLQVSEIAKQERDHATSGDLLERALFSFGRAVHSTFAKHLAEGKARLDFSRPENRELWLASWRYMQNLSMRATWRTVYEWAKLLLSLSPEQDPYAIWLILDQYALRARQDLDFLNLSRNSNMKEVHKNMPNVQLSQGLAEWRAGNKSKGQQALFTAVGRFPWVVARLMQELGVDPPPGIWGKEPRTEKEKLYTELYATRAKDLWNTPEASGLLVEVASALAPDTPSAELNTIEITRSEARHVLLSDTPALIALVPRKYTTAITSASDPLPPEDSQPSYLPERSRAAGPPAPAPDRGPLTADSLRELQGLYGFFSNLFPWFNRDGSEGDAAANVEIEPSQDQIEQRIRESGLDEQTIMERTQRMVELQANIMAQRNGAAESGVDGGDEDDQRTMAAIQDVFGAAVPRQPQVEDAEDTGN